MPSWAPVDGWPRLVSDTDNAVAESFFATLKRERVDRCQYRTRDEATTDLFQYIEVFYNRHRRHSTLGHMSPVLFEAVDGSAKIV